VPLYGLDKELAEKAALKFDKGMETEAREWILAMLGEEGPSDLKDPEGTLHAALKSGVALVLTVNKIQPGICKKPSTMSMPFKQMENIGFYLEACQKLGVPAPATFQTVDLFENKNMMQVLTNIHALGAIAQKMPDYAGPTLGVKLADANKREFTAEQLKAGKAEQTFLGKGSSGQANQAGMHDTSRNIDKNSTVQGLGPCATSSSSEVGLMGKGSHGLASQAGMHDHSKDIDKMKHVS